MVTPSTSAKFVADVMEVWGKLENGLNTAFRREAMSSSHYMEFYTSVYNYCTSITLASTQSKKQPEKPSVNRTSQGADFVGHEMYRRVKDYVTSYVVDVREKGIHLNGENLLQFYTHEWLNFQISSKVMNGIFSYLNRHWIRRELDEGHEDIYMIYTLALMVWKENLFAPLKEKVIDAVLELIKKERNGEIINKGYISGVVECLVELGIDEYEAGEAAVTKRQEKDKLSVYHESFEIKFLQATKEFYNQEASEFLMREGSVTDYMLKVEKRLEEEESRCLMYLNSATKAPLATCCEEVLIASRLDFFQNEFGGLLTANRDDDLARMFKLCERVTNGLDNLRISLEVHITKEGHEALEKVSTEAFNDARLYVKTLLDVHQRYQKLVQNSFSGDPGFMQALDKAATQFINRNAVTNKAVGALSNSKSAELLARYCDQLLRKTSKMPDERELEELLNKIIVVFKYIDDKDVFSKYYTKMFSKRLINELSASDEAEANFISKLKSMCGYEYTARLSKMVNDTQVSKDLCAEFRDKLTTEKKSKIGLEFNILVLSSGSWPLFSPTTMNLPSKLSESIELFADYYNEKFSGRRLSWIYSQSKGEVVSQCFPKKYVFTATTAQMVTILLFNEQDSYTMKQLTEATGMETKFAPTVISSLIKNELLKADKAITGDDVPEETIITLNKGYSNKKVRVDLSKMAIKQDTSKESETVHKNVEEDRKSVISACIVRIMKTRKRVSHQQLMTEVIQQLEKKFKPKVEMIKRCIGSLIEKEYMMRAEGHKDIYEYMA